MDFDPREGAPHYTKRKDKAFFHAQTEQRFSADNDATPDIIAEEMDRILACDLLVVHFPLWWFGPPAILKGWMDRTFVYGRMYRSTVRYDAGICAGKRMLACVTTGASEDSCAFNGREGDTQMHLWPILIPFRYLGFTVLKPAVYHGIGGVAFMEAGDTETDPQQALYARWSETLRDLDHRQCVRYNADTDFGDDKRLLRDAPVYSPFVRQCNTYTDS